MKRFLWILFYLFIFSLLIHTSFSYLDPDFGWHLRSGETVWLTKTVPHDQIFMWTLAGKNWVDHEWLGNLGLYGLWSAGGYIAVTLAFALLPLLALALINRHLLRFYIKKTETVAALVVIEIVALLFTLPHFGVRLQELSFLFLAGLLILLDRFHQDQKIARLWLLLPLMYIWSASHAGFLIGLFIIALNAIYEIGLLLTPKVFSFCQRRPLTKKVLWQLILISILSLATTFLTPYGLELYSFLGGYRDSYYMSHIQEWRSPFSFPIHYGQIFINSLAVVTTLGTLFFLRKRALLFNCLLTLIFVGMAFRSLRHFPLLVVAWLLLIIPHCLPELTEHFYLSGKKFVVAITAICLLTLSLLFIVDTRVTTQPFKTYCGSYPCAGIKFLREHPAYQEKIFNHYNYGGFMIGVWPTSRLFIDGRLPQFPFAGVTILEEYNRFNQSDLVAQKLNEYGIKTVFYSKPPSVPHFNWFEKYILGYKDKDFIDTKSPLLEYIKSQPDWRKVYEDKLCYIYVRQ